MLYKRCYDTIRLLLQAEKPLTIGDLAQSLSVSARTVRNDLESIDGWLTGFGHRPITRQPGVGLYLNDPDGEVSRRLRAGQTDYVLSTTERVRIILGMLLINTGKTSIIEIANRLEVSSATISNDIRKVKSWLEEYGVQLVSKPHLGILIQDSERNIRRGCIMLLREILETGTHQQELIGARFIQVESLLAHYRMDRFCEALSMWREEILDIISDLQTCDGVSISDNGFCALFCYLLINLTRVRQGFFVQFTPEERRYILEKPGIQYRRIEREIQSRTGLHLNEDEMHYLNVQWMSLRKFGASKNLGLEMIVAARELIVRIRDGIDLAFDADENIVAEIATHLNVMSYRLLLNVPAEHNPVLTEIESAFPQLCDVIRHKLRILVRERYGDSFDRVCDREAVYIAMHIIAGIHKSNKTADLRKNIIIVCGNTVATSKILENRLKTIFSNVNVVRTMSYHEFVNSQKSLECDLVLSTFPLESKRYPCVTVNPLLKWEDINKLINILTIRMQTVDLNQYIGATINIASRSLGLTPEEKIKLSLDLARGIEEERRELSFKKSPALKNLLRPQLVRTQVRVKGCYDAIQQGGDLLKREGLIGQEHIDKMIRLKKKLGGYIVIDKGVAMPHLLVPTLAEPCMSLITLEKPVKFHNPDNDPVDLVIVLLSNNNTSHIKVLEELVDLLNDPVKNTALRKAKTPGEIFSLIYGESLWAEQ